MENYLQIHLQFISCLCLDHLTWSKKYGIVVVSTFEFACIKHAVIVGIIVNFEVKR